MKFTRTHAIILGLTLLGLTSIANAQGIAGLEGAEAAADGLASWMRGTFAKTVISIALCACGFMATFRNLSWTWPLMVLVGAFFIFGGPGLVDQAVTWFGS